MTLNLHPIAIAMAAGIVALIVGFAVYSTGKPATPPVAALPPQKPWAPGTWEADAAAYLANHSPATSTDRKMPKSSK